MRTRTLAALLSLVVLTTLLLAPPAFGQQTQKRSEVEFLPAGEAEELAPRPWGFYDFSLSLELGHQQSIVNGNNDVYRTHLNYNDGFRVFSFNFRGKGQDGAFFSDFYARGAGWGGDPQNWLRFGASKDKWFDFRARYRRNSYFWLFPGFARDQHRNDQERRMQRYDLTLLPGRPVRFHLGYSRNSSLGMSLITQDFSRDEFLFFSPVRQTYDEYRGGVDWTLQRWNFFFEQGYRFFRNDRFEFLPETFNPGNDTGDLTVLTDFDRATPTRGEIPFTRLTVTGRPHHKVDVTTRIVHSDIDINATRFETNSGTTFQGVDRSEVFLTGIDADRSQTVADGSITVRPIRNLSISNHLRFDQYNITGLALTDETIIPVAGPVTLVSESGQHLLNFEGYRNRFEGRYDINRWVSLRGGFLYIHRDVQIVEFEDNVLEHDDRFDLNTRTFLLGIIARPHSKASVFFNWERGNATGIFTRLSPNNMDRLRLRARVEPVEGVRFAGSFFLFDNESLNLPTAVDANARHTSRNRGGTIDFQLTRFERGYLNIGYGRTDLTTRTDAAFFAFFALRGDESLYIFDESYAYIDVGGRIAGNLWGDLGYRVTSTSGTFPPSDPVATCDPFVPGSCTSAGTPGPVVSNRGGLNYHQPHASLRYAFSDNLTWQGGWRWYGYNVKQGTFSDYKAHIVTTSLLLSF